MYVIVRQGGKNPLKSGPMGINVYTCQLSDVIVSPGIFPRFIPVVMSHYMESDREYFERCLSSWGDFVELGTALRNDDREIFNA